MAKSNNEKEQEKALAKATEYDNLAIDVAAGEDPLSQKAMNPDAISGNIYGRGKAQKGKKSK
ncbi:MAG: hypothetical protein HN416_16235 [Nitrospina sp.]|jgi:hypothetical protein|nr:hypothetical protein [Nitrospina sp.]